MLPISDKALHSVKSLLAKHKVTDFSVNKYRDMVEATLTVSQANAMFRTEVKLFTHSNKRVQLLRATRAYSLPKDVAAHVAFVGDLVRLPAVRTPIRVSAGGPGKWPNSCEAEEGCAGLVQPAVLTKRYNVNGSVTAEGNSMSVAVETITKDEDAIYPLAPPEPFSCVTCTRFVDLNADGAGQIYQEFDVKMGATYVLSMWVSADYVGTGNAVDTPEKSADRKSVV